MVRYVVFFVQNSVDKPNNLLFYFAEHSVVTEDVEEGCTKVAVLFGEVLDAHVAGEFADARCFCLAEVLWAWVLGRLSVDQPVFEGQRHKLVVDFETLLDAAGVEVRVRLVHDGDGRGLPSRRKQVLADG
jgi:hypothetical protein